MTYELSPGSLLPPLSRPVRRAPLLPILAPPAAAQGVHRYPTAEMHIKNNCGDDNVMHVFVECVCRCTGVHVQISQP